MTRTPDRSTPPPGPTFREINADLRTRRIWPLRRFVLYTGGAHIHLLRVVPVETREFTVLGSGVLLTTGMAFLSGYIATRMMVTPAPSVHVGLVIAGLFAFAIYTIDRLLVSGTLRPHSFDSETLTTLWDPYADARWYTLIAGTKKDAIRDTLRGFPVVIAKVAVRFALAAFISYLIADLIVVYAFKPAVDNQAREILKLRITDQRAENGVAFGKAVADAQQQRQTSLDSLGKNSGVQTAQKAVTGLIKAVQDDNDDVDKMNRVVFAESQGIKGVSVTLSNKTRFPASPTGTTGKRGCRPQDEECQDLKTELSRLETKLEGDNSSLTTARQNLQKANDAAGGSATSIQKTYDEAVAAAAAARAQADHKADLMPTDPQDLLIRRAALRQLEQDTQPWTGKLSHPQQACSTGFKALCSWSRQLLPTTPLGIYTGSLRAILFLIDITPIILKIIYSLRRRRAYDVLTAALEETSVADSINQLDYELNDRGRQMEDRAVVRRGARRAAGARIVRETVRARTRDDVRRSHWVRRDVAKDYEESVARMRPAARLFSLARRKLRLRVVRHDILVVDRRTSPWRRSDRAEPSVRQDIPRSTKVFDQEVD